MSDQTMTQDEALELALRWAGAGIPSLPLAISWDPKKSATNKRPLTRQGFLDASTDPEQLRQEFDRALLRADEVWGVGLWLGPAGMVALDVDVKGGARGDEELRAPEEQYGKLPDTPRVVTPSGGEHVWLRKGSLFVDNTDFAPHIETRGDAGLVVAPGTRTPWGSWEFDLAGGDVLEGAPVAEAPRWVLDRLSHGAGSTNGAGSRSGHWRHVDPAALHPADRAAMEALQRLGGHGECLAVKHRDGERHETLCVTRPGKTAGTSATVGYVAPGLVKVFSSNWVLFDGGGPRLHEGATYDADRVAAIADAVDAGDRERAETLCDPRHQESATGSETDWPEIIPLSQGGHRPPFPLDELPGWLQRYVRAVAEFTQAPADLAALLGLSVIGAVLAKNVEVEVRRNWREPLNIYTVTALLTGERKSAVFRLVLAPLEALERTRVTEWKPEAAAARARRQVLEARVKQARSKLAPKEEKAKVTDAAPKVTDAAPKAASGTETETDAAEKELTAAEEKLAGHVIPPAPRLIADDITQEALATLISEQGGKIGLFSAEGGIFEILAGRYTEGRPNIELFLKAYSGDSVRIDRKGRPPEHVDSPAITLGLTVQPTVIAGLASNRGFRDRGLLARILYALPESRVGYRTSQPIDIDAEVERRYLGRVEALGGIHPASANDATATPHVLLMTPDAVLALAAYQDQVEAHLGPGGQMQPFADWANRLPGTAARLAGILHMAEAAEAGSVDTMTPIGEATIGSAIRICGYLTEHAVAAFELMGADPLLEGARRILAWVADKELAEFTKREAFIAHRATFSRVAELARVLALLVEHGYLVQKPEDRSGPGRPASPTFIVNPLAQKSHNAQKSGLGDPKTNSVNTANSALKADGDTETGEVCANCGSAYYIHDGETGRPLCRSCVWRVDAERRAAGDGEVR